MKAIGPLELAGAMAKKPTEMDRSPVLILGAGGHGRVVAQVLRAAGREIAGFLDDAAAKTGTEVDGVRVLGTSEDAARLASSLGASVIVGVGDNAQRGMRQSRLQAEGLTIASSVDPSAVIAPGVSVEAGAVVMPGAVVNIGCKLGVGSVVNTSAVLDHDTELGDYAHASPGAITSGGVSVGVFAWLGAGAIVLPGVRIGEHAVVGAGAVVREDVAASTTVAGVPARPIGDQA